MCEAWLAAAEAEVYREGMVKTHRMDLLLGSNLGRGKGGLVVWSGVRWRRVVEPRSMPLLLAPGRSTGCWCKVIMTAGRAQEIWRSSSRHAVHTCDWEHLPGNSLGQDSTCLYCCDSSSG